MPSSLHTLLCSLCMILCMAVKAAEIQLNGIPLDKKEELVAELSPRLDFIKTRPPSAWRADDAAFFLKRLLIRKGHADADVQWELPGGNTIILKAKAGPRYKYGKITASRLEILTQDELRNYFLQPLVETELVEAEKAPYISEYNEAGVNNVTNLLRSRGYWKASVSIQRIITRPDNRRMDILLNIRPGSLHRVARPTFSGATSEEVAIFQQKIQNLIGKVADTEALTEIRKTPESYYSEQGYEFAKITVTPSHRNGLTYLHFDIKKGQILEVDDVRITGDEFTKPRRIRRYFDHLRNQPFDREKANKALSKLLSTGAFTRATLRTVASENATLDLAIDVQEAKARSLRSYVGVGSFEGFIIGSSYTDLNFRGRLLRLNLRGEYSGRGLLGEASLTEPRFAGEAIELNARAYLLQRTYEGYDKKEGGFEVSLLWSPDEHFSTRLYSAASRVDTSSTSLTPTELGPEQYLHMRAGIQQTADFRDNVTIPTQGFYSSLLLEYGNVSGDASTGYFLSKLDTSYRYRLNEKQHLMARFSTGMIQAGDSSDLPIDLRLFSGGADSVRSYNLRELGPRSLSDDPIGGEAYWNASLQYIRSISDPIRAVLFFDAGQVYQKPSNWGFSDPDYAVGLGLRIDLPIGPVRLEYGHNLNRKSGQPDGTFHFAIGTSF